MAKEEAERGEPKNDVFIFKMILICMNSENSPRYKVHDRRK